MISSPFCLKPFSGFLKLLGGPTRSSRSECHGLQPPTTACSPHSQLQPHSTSVLDCSLLPFILEPKPATLSSHPFLPSRALIAVGNYAFIIIKVTLSHQIRTLPGRDHVLFFYSLTTVSPAPSLMPGTQ